MLWKSLHHARMLFPTLSWVEHTWGVGIPKRCGIVLIGWQIRSHTGAAGCAAQEGNKVDWSHLSVLHDGALAQQHGSSCTVKLTQWAESLQQSKFTIHRSVRARVLTHLVLQYTTDLFQLYPVKITSNSPLWQLHNHWKESERLPRWWWDQTSAGVFVCKCSAGVSAFRSVLMLEMVGF